jgi:hypothetical protein
MERIGDDYYVVLININCVPSVYGIGHSDSLDWLDEHQWLRIFQESVVESLMSHFQHLSFVQTSRVRHAGVNRNHEVPESKVLSFMSQPTACKLFRLALFPVANC